MKARIHDRVRAIAANATAKVGVEAVVHIDAGAPVTWNDPAQTAAMAPTPERVYGAERASHAPRITGAEDFAEHQRAAPGLFCFIGGRPPDVPAEQTIPNHSPFLLH